MHPLPPLQWHSKSIASEPLLTFVLDAMEVGVPVMWAFCGGLAYAAWNRIEEKSGNENVDKVRSAYPGLQPCTMTEHMLMPP